MEGETRNLVVYGAQTGLGIPQVLPQERVRVRGCPRVIGEVCDSYNLLLTKSSPDLQFLILKITRFRATGRTKRTAALVNDWQKLSQPEKDAWEKKAAARSVDLSNWSFHTKKSNLVLLYLGALIL